MGFLRWNPLYLQPCEDLKWPLLFKWFGMWQAGVYSFDRFLKWLLESHFFELPWGNYGTKIHHRTFYSKLKMKRYLLIAIYRAAGLIIIFCSNALVCQIGRVYNAFLLRQIVPLWTIKSLMISCCFNQATAYCCFRESGIKWVTLLHSANGQSNLLQHFRYSAFIQSNMQEIQPHTTQTKTRPLCSDEYNIQVTLRSSILHLLLLFTVCFTFGRLDEYRLAVCPQPLDYFLWGPCGP